MFSFQLVTQVDLYDKPPDFVFPMYQLWFASIQKSKRLSLGCAASSARNAIPTKKIAVDLHQQLGVVEEMLEGEIMVAERFRWGDRKIWHLTAKLQIRDI